ncbi:helicase associated domain-containing protein [Arthrobacter sp. 9E18]|uniref:helicase associated domain-containing protein n=2 Tax=Arthrobacter TaxID=1663 RepID=UPI0011B01735|nr:helicase associated domain-containing protein [Arthrobacter sp. 9E18]
MLGQFDWLLAMSRSATLEHDNVIDFVAPQHWSREEWFYMWTKGLDPRRIAIVCRVPYRKVYEHIHARVSYKPERFGQRLMLHDHPKLPPGGLKKPTPKIPWMERAGEVSRFRREHGRFPRGYLDGEQQLYSFLQYQRKQYRAGKLPTVRKSFLDEHLPGWLTPPKKEREDALWTQRVRELDAFLRQYGRIPQYKTAEYPLEKVLSVWVTRQRHCKRLGNLDPEREQLIHKSFPWLLATIHSSAATDGQRGLPVGADNDETLTLSKQGI